MKQKEKQRNIAKLLKQNGEQIVISGMGSRFPLSNSIYKLVKNLYKNIDMISDDENEERWPNCKFKIYLQLISFYSHNL